MGETRRPKAVARTAASARLQDKALLVLASVTVLAVTFGIAPFQSSPAGTPAFLSAALSP